MPDPRHTLLSVYRHALACVHGTALVRDSFGGVDGECRVIALGKAAAAMAVGALATPGLDVRGGFVAIPHGYEPFTPRPDWEVHYGGHPLPDRASLVAGAALVTWLASLPAHQPLVALVSGGSSSCIEHLRDGMSLGEAARRTDELLAAGADIRALNAARSEWSRLKQGRALALAGEREVHVRVLADVPGDDPKLVGSGAFFSSHLGARLRVVAGNGAALDAAAGAAAEAGFGVTRHGELSGDAARAGAAIARALQRAEPGVHLWGGETTVALPAAPGRGGRCQHLALAAARALDGVARVTLLAAGTDGIDGASADAGAIVDGGSVARMRDDGVDPDDALRRADSNRALAAAGDLINTGPTGTNVRDLVIGLVSGSDPSV